MSSSSSPGGAADRSRSLEERREGSKGSSQNSQNKRSPRSGDAQSSRPQNPSTQDPSHAPVIKKEAGLSPEQHPTSNPSARRRPRNLDLSQQATAGQATGAGRPSAPLTSKDSAGLSAMQDVGLACLSPGFQTQDPSMQHQLARSMEMREKQRQIIEARLHGKPGTDIGTIDSGPPSSAFAKLPISSKRKGPPPGLSISTPSAQQFASEPRVIQSAPLNQSFTGLKPSGHVHPLSRQVLDRHPGHTHGAHPHQPHFQHPHTGNRLPPISDVLSNEALGSRHHPDTLKQPNSAFHAPHTTYSPHAPHGPLPSPGYPQPPASAGLAAPPRGPPTSQPIAENSSVTSRPREFKSAEEAVQTLSGGREDLLPRIVHYGSRQPPTPSHPPPPGRQDEPPRSGSGRRRTREEYERDIDHADRMDVDGAERGRERARRGYWEEERERTRRGTAQGTGMFGPARDSPETDRRKKEEFLGLWSRMWDLIRS
ncbi:MAG: hypothetical protein M1828_007378 [Chrysothrix sp. TS-e1954]|nr:MAG: hypothetical protein M1828_007378 [Chrysothrix sp. TS-e1954]